MRKILAMLMMLCMLMAMDCASAEDTVVMLEQIVRSALDSAMIEYDYDAENQWFDLSFDLKRALGSTGHRACVVNHFVDGYGQGCHIAIHYVRSRVAYKNCVHSASVNYRC